MCRALWLPGALGQLQLVMFSFAIFEIMELNLKYVFKKENEVAPGFA